MRIWLRGRVVVAPRIRTGRDGLPVVCDGVFAYRRWQQWLNRIAPKTFPTVSLFYDQETGEQRVCGIPVDELVRRYEGASSGG